MITKTQKFQDSKTPNNLKKENYENPKIFDLETRLNVFFQRVAKLCKNIQLDARNSRVISQLIASSGSIGANYAEASEAMSKKDFVKCLKISRKEAKETKVWLNGLKIIVDFTDPEFDALIQESNEFIYIFTSILKKTDV